MTKQLLKQSLLELLEQNNINNITVKAICENADLNRSTFYAYYSSPYDLFDSMKKDIIEETRALLDCDLCLSPKKRMKYLLEKHLRYLHAHIKEFQIYSSDIGEDFSLPFQLMEDLMMPYLEYLHEIHPVTDIKFEVLCSYCIYGGIGVIKRWVRQSMSVPIELVSENVMGLIDGTFEGQGYPAR